MKGIGTVARGALNDRYVKFIAKKAVYDRLGNVRGLYFDIDVRHYSSRVSKQASRYETSFEFLSPPLRTQVKLYHGVHATWSVWTGRSIDSKETEIELPNAGSLVQGDEQEIESREFEEILWDTKGQDAYDVQLQHNNGMLELMFNLPEDNKLEASVYAMNGKLVKELFPGSMESSGLHSGQVQLSSLPAGLYFIKCIYADQLKVLKFIKK